MTRTAKEVTHEKLTATLIVFFLLLLRPDNAAASGRHGGNRSEAPYMILHHRPCRKIGRYPSGFV